MTLKVRVGRCVGAAAVAVLSLTAIARLRADDSWIDQFSKTVYAASRAQAADAAAAALAEGISPESVGEAISLAANPQLWLIPPALSLLVAAQLNRQRLKPEVLAAIRYAATIVIYVSSTSEIVTRGFAAGLLPPMALLGLAVAGALAGIALRVRGFLILGSTFTLILPVAKGVEGMPGEAERRTAS